MIRDEFRDMENIDMDGEEFRLDFQIQGLEILNKEIHTYVEKYYDYIYTPDTMVYLIL